MEPHMRCNLLLGIAVETCASAIALSRFDPELFLGRRRLREGRTANRWAPGMSILEEVPEEGAKDCSVNIIEEDGSAGVSPDGQKINFAGKLDSQRSTDDRTLP